MKHGGTVEMRAHDGVTIWRSIVHRVRTDSTCRVVIQRCEVFELGLLQIAQFVFR